MSLIAWLFLYVAGLIELAVRYRVPLDSGHTAGVLLLPLAFAPLLPVVRNRIAFPRALITAGVLLTVSCSAIFARSVSLDVWDVGRMDLAWLSVGIGVGALLCVRDELAWSMQALSWCIVSLGWLLAAWNPAGQWLALAPAATLALWRGPQEVRDAPHNATATLSASWTVFWIGITISKPWWDSDDLSAPATALWALAVAASHHPLLRGLRLPAPLWCLTLFGLSYGWLPIWLWAPIEGLLCGWALQRTRQPWRLTCSYALAGGLVLSYVLHSNLQLTGWLLWGER